MSAARFGICLIKYPFLESGYFFVLQEEVMKKKQKTMGIIVMVLVCVATIGIWCESNASREPSSVEVIASQASASGTAVSTKDEVATESVELTWGKK